MDNFLTIKEAVNKYIAGCEAKIRTSPAKLVLKAVLAGMMIALGAAGSSVASHNTAATGPARLLTGVVFPVGLMMVILTGAELFTGDCLMIMGTASKKHKPAQLFRVLALVYIGNFIGSLLVAWAVSASGQWDYSGGLLGAYTIKIALGKVTISMGKAVVSGILCNILVCAAVIMAMCAKDIAGKLLAAFFLIFLFVVSGLYYIAAGLFAKMNPAYVQAATEQYGYAANALEGLNAVNFLIRNLLPVTVGNIVGGMACLGLPLWYTNRD